MRIDESVRRDKREEKALERQDSYAKISDRVVPCLVPCLEGTVDNALRSAPELRLC